eukprot:CAMPEP_0181315982 /NCGR_PEP_ID=MMETSP1101-20121128/15656_1 /TAXON_ID=46948 /ORGANISM="Rhodomonas abbreviata, Strain Caron Lab Isolate" /LENGTH=134 /DNA_ID=CAMNT_0023423207 /DNA_START=20 /DNA_END=424 /DNA_ORIENTATION=-
MFHSSKVPIFGWIMAACSALLVVLALVGYHNGRSTVLRQDLQHTLVPGSSSYLAASSYRNQLQQQSIAGQIAYEKKKAAAREVAMEKGMKQAAKLYSYTQKHGYGKDQRKQMWKTLAALEKPTRASEAPQQGWD